jgi:PPOX class probable F420-dependent enzyme
MVTVIPEHHREFVRSNRLCVLSWNRGPGATEAPPLTPVFYVMDGDDVLISITEDRAKTPALRRDPAISVCVLGEAMPFPYVTLFGTATIEQERAFEVMHAVVESLGRQLDDEAREKLRARAEREHRVVLRVTAHRSVSNVPAPS